MQEHFITKFDNPVFKVYQDWTQKKQKQCKQNNIFVSIEEWLALNNEYPSSFLFTPNGRYGLSNTKWERVTTAKPSQTYISAIIAKWEWEIKDVDCSMIISSWETYYYLWILNPKDRKVLYSNYWDNLLELPTSLVDDIDTVGIWEFLPYPWSYVWQGISKVEVKIVKDTWKVFDYLDVQRRYLLRTQREEVARDIKMLLSKNTTVGYYNKILKLNIEEVINSTSWDVSCEDWVIYYKGKEVPWYEIEWNRVVYNGCESAYDTPIWNPYEFLYFFYKGNRSLVFTHLARKFDLFMWEWGKSLWKVCQIFSEFQYSIFIYEKWIVISEEKTLKDWTVYEKEKILFRWEIEILWKGYVKQSSMWESDKQRAYIISVNWEEGMVIPKSNKRDHNKTYKDGLFFYWDDDQLWLFYEALNNDKSIKEIDVYELSWYYKDKVILWGSVVYWELGWDKIMTQHTFPNASDLEQITVKEYFEKYREIYNDSLAIPSFLQALALAWMNLWQGFNTYPALLLSGKTGSGKTAMQRILKAMIWYWASARSLSLPGITPQPLKQAASDYSVLFLEELTQKVSPYTEELVRNVVNRDIAARGALEKNIEFNLRAPVFCVGERSFKDESLNNRFVICVTSRKQWKEWGKQDVNTITRFTACDDIYKTYLEKQDVVCDIARRYALDLVDQWVDSRSADTYSYIFAINDIFELGIKNDYLKKIVLSNIKESWFDKPVELWSRDYINKFIIRYVGKRDCAVNAYDTNDGNWFTYHFECTLFSDENFQTERVILSSTLLDLNTELWVDRFKLTDTWFIVSYPAMNNLGKFVNENSQIINDNLSKILDKIPNNSSVKISAEYLMSML